MIQVAVCALTPSESSSGSTRGVFRVIGMIYFDSRTEGYEVLLPQRQRVGDRCRMGRRRQAPPLAQPHSVSKRAAPSSAAHHHPAVRIDKAERQITAIRELVHEGMRLVIQSRKDIRALNAAQTRTDASLKALIESLRSGANGTPTARRNTKAARARIGKKRPRPQPPTPRGNLSPKHLDGQRGQR